MSVKRYDYIGQGDCEMAEFENGPYVRHDDYAALQTVANHYKGEVDRLEAECARLREEALKFKRIVGIVCICEACPVCQEIAEHALDPRPVTESGEG